jgi:methyl-accepting chemotaxis protein
MARTVILMALVLLLALVPAFSSVALAQEQQQPQNAKPWTDEEYRAFYATISEQNQAKKIQLGEDFLTKFPNTALTPLVTRFLVIFYLQGQNLQKAFQTAEAYFSSTSEKYAEAFKLVLGPQLEKAGATLPSKPNEDVQLLLFLIDTVNKAARNNNHAFDDKGLKYAQQALTFIKNGGVPPTIPPETWKMNEKVIEAVMHQTIGLIKVGRQQYAEAIEHLNTAGQLDSSDPVTFYMTGEALLSSDYAKLGSELEKMRKDYAQMTEELKQLEEQVNQINEELGKLSKLPDTPKNKQRIEELTRQGQELSDKGKATSEQAEQLSGQIDQKVAEVDAVVDRMIEAYAKTVALSDKLPQLQQTARSRLEKFYMYRHQNSLDGLEELIQKMKSPPRPTSPGQ